jgi:type VI secretion system protein VasI
MRMKQRRALVWMALMLAAGGACEAQGVPDATRAADPSGPQKCAGIMSGQARLACFDAAIQPAVPHRTVISPEPEMFRFVADNESHRAKDNWGFLMSDAVEYAPTDQHRVIISGPAVNLPAPRPYLVVACVSNLTRFQLLMPRPVSALRASVTMSVDGKTSGGARTWQTLDGGRILDAGYGVPAIQYVNSLSGAQRIRIQAGDPEIGDLQFDAQGLGAAILVQRKACHW